MAFFTSIEQHQAWRVITRPLRKQLERDHRCTWDRGERYCGEKGVAFDPRGGWRCLEHVEAGEGEAS